MPWQRLADRKRS